MRFWVGDHVLFALNVCDRPEKWPSLTAASPAAELVVRRIEIPATVTNVGAGGSYRIAFGSLPAEAAHLAGRPLEIPDGRELRHAGQLCSFECPRCGARNDAHEHSSCACGCCGAFYRLRDINSTIVRDAPLPQDPVW